MNARDFEIVEIKKQNHKGLSFERKEGKQNLFKKGHRYTQEEASRKIRSARYANGNRVFFLQRNGGVHSKSWDYSADSLKRPVLYLIQKEHDEDWNEMLAKGMKQP